VEKFSRLAAEWWDPHGKFAVLHKFNPVRLAYIRDHATARFARDPHGPRPLEGLRLLDIGCGGGLLAEPMARLGADVVAIDPSATNIATARLHGEEAGLAIDYRAATAEEVAAGGETFDVILNMEVIEHVIDPAAFVAVCGGLLEPGGLMFVATLNRTLEELRIRHHRRRICSGLAAPRHPPLGKVHHAGGTQPLSGGRRAQAGGHHRRRLQSPDRDLGPVARHGRQLHGGGGQAEVGAVGRISEA
jgi:ubiquinone biosynthesis O-methyltransferase